MDKIRYGILIATICAGLLAGCGKNSSVSDDSGEDSSLVDVSEQEVESSSMDEVSKMLSCVRFAEAIGLDEFDSVSELKYEVAVGYACLNEYRSRSEGSLLDEYGVDVSEDGSVELSKELVEEMLLKYFGDGDVDSYDLSGNESFDAYKVSDDNGSEIDLDGIKKVVNNFKFNNFVKSVEGLNSVVDDVDLKLVRTSFADGVWSIEVDRVKDDGSVENLQYGLIKNDDGSYCLKYKKILD